MKLTEADIVLIDEDEKYMDVRIYSKADFDKLKKQFLSDYEKARKWDEYKKRYKSDLEHDVNWNHEVIYCPDQKLRELLEKKIEDFQSRKLPHIVIHELQKLLEESKK